MITLAELGKELKSLKSAIVTSHIAPDADAIGSSAALALALQSAGVKVSLWYGEPVPSRLDALLTEIKPVRELPPKVDALVVVDTATRARVSGASEELFARADRVFNIDHHVSNPDWGDVNYLDADAAASAAIVFRLAEAAGFSVTPAMAQLLYGGLLDDTGCFRFSNTTQEALAVAGALVGAGAEPARVAELLYFTVPQRVLQLKALAMAGMRLLCGGKIAFVCITRKELERCGASPEDTEGIIDEARLIEGTAGAVFMRELEEGWKFSLRSKDERLDVNAVAGRFGGGGHRAAAGCKLTGTQQQVEEQILAALDEALKGSGIL